MSRIISTLVPRVGTSARFSICELCNCTPRHMSLFKTLEDTQDKQIQKSAEKEKRIKAERAPVRPTPVLDKYKITTLERDLEEARVRIGELEKGQIEQFRKVIKEEQAKMEDLEQQLSDERKTVGRLENLLYDKYVRGVPPPKYEENTGAKKADSKSDGEESDCDSVYSSDWGYSDDSDYEESDNEKSDSEKSEVKAEPPVKPAPEEVKEASVKPEPEKLETQIITKEDVADIKESLSWIAFMVTFGVVMRIVGAILYFFGILV